MSKAFHGNLFFFLVLLLLILGSFFIIIPITIFKLPGYYAIILPEVLFLLLPALIYLAVSKKPVKTIMRLNPLGLKNSVIIAVIIILSMPLSQLIAVITNIFFPNNVSQALNFLNNLGFLPQLLIIALTPAICEEVVFRGVVLGEYGRVNIKIAAVANGFLFGLFHLNPFQFFYTFFLGILLAYMVYITNSLFAGILGHFIFNGMQIALSDLLSNSTAQSNTASGKLSSGAIAVLAAFVLIGCLYGIIRLMILLKNINRKSSETLERDEPSDDTVLNWPFFGGIGVYAVFIILEQVYLSFLKIKS